MSEDKPDKPECVISEANLIVGVFAVPFDLQTGGIKWDERVTLEDKAFDNEVKFTIKNK